MSDPLTLIHGDALSSLRGLPDESVQTCVTSPPYWGLRDYGLEPSIWGPLSRPREPAQCRHEWSETIPGNSRGGSGTPTDKNNRGESYGRDAERGAFCECGAWRGCLGLEPTPELYVSHMVEIFRELKRVLRSDGTLWLNLGDSYAGGGRGGNPDESPYRKQATNTGSVIGATKSAWPVPATCKPKDLVGIPWMVAFALRADGWYLRSDIIWSKPNPMPESVTDRPTKSHEYIFLLSKSQKYFFDADAVREPPARPEWMYETATTPGNGDRNDGGCTQRKQRGHGRPHEGFNTKWDMMAKQEQAANGRNIRTVWTIATRPFPEAHFATFPPELITPCILAGTKPGDVVIDPFAGSGTTGKVAIELGRKAILIEPKAEYIEMIKRRCQTTIGLPMTG